MHSTIAAGRMRRAFPFELVLLILLPLLIQLPALTGWLSADPIYREAAMPPGVPSQIFRGDPGWVDGNSGATTQALGHLAAEQWLAGTVPWWNHFTGLGMPLAAEMQNSALFLPFVLLLHFQDGVLFLKIAMQVMCGLSMAALLREHHLKRIAVFAGAVLFEFSGTLAWFAHGPIMPIAFLPLLVLGIEHAKRHQNERRPGGWALIAVAIAGSIYAGFPETAFMDGLIALVIAVARLAQQLKRTVRDTVGLGTRICLGGLVGLMLSAPAWLPFGLSLPVSLVGQNTDFSGTHLLSSSYAMLVFPYALGPILYGAETLGKQADIWWHTGGYCDLCLLIAGLAALLSSGRTERTLRAVLGVWLLASFAKAAGVPIVAGVFDLIPFVRQTMFYVYASPGWQFCLIVLAAMLLDDVCRGATLGRSRVALLFAGAVALGAASLLLARPAISELIDGHAPHYRIYLFGSVLWGLLGLAALLLVRRRPVAIAIVLVLNGIVLFELPVLSGTRNGTVDTQAVTALRDEVGIGRGYGLSRMAPNYGAFFGVPMLNYTYVPVPTALAARMLRDMDPTMDVTGLFGDHLRGYGQIVPNPFKPQLNAAQSVHRLEALGVRDLLVPHDADPLGDEIGPLDGIGQLVPAPAANGSTASGTMTVPTGDATLSRMGIVLGTYGTHPTGTLELTVCAGDRCEHTTADLGRVSDNQTLWFDRPFELKVTADEHITFTMTTHITAGSLAIWRVPLSADGHESVPFFVFGYRSNGITLRTVFDNGSTAILRLPDPKPYVESMSAGCRLEVIDRDVIETACDKPDVLLRRELFYPGWTARLDGRSLPIAAADGDTFQAVSLPAGKGRLVFRYAPPFIGAATAAAAAGIFLLLLNATRRRRKSDAAQNGSVALKQMDAS